MAPVGSIVADSVSWSAGGRMVIDGVSLVLGEGETLGLLGPNGSGKSSLLRLLAGLRRPSGGAVLLDGQSLGGHRRRTLAQRIAVVEQQASTGVSLTVEQIVRLGRIPHHSVWSGAAEANDSAVERALAQTATTDMRNRDWHTLSGGEQQRVQIARALAQEPRELLLDEPTNHLDIRHQLELLALIRDLPVTAVVTLHDLTLAALFCDRLVVLTDGRVAAAGTPAAVLTPALISSVYGVDVNVIADGAGAGRPAVHLLPPRR
ncbi:MULTISPECIES: ABC transporter ATP-binding protein [unclassified Mycolicibacterium]|uniref:ABC transporter ATP-binding protein n=1 Tax=unclassified Mycolicibacterium TaxID=2636767 RepID=UPI002ED7B09E